MAPWQDQIFAELRVCAILEIWRIVEAAPTLLVRYRRGAVDPVYSLPARLDERRRRGGVEVNATVATVVRSCLAGALWAPSAFKPQNSSRSRHRAKRQFRL
jgi:hypothetical protein